MKQRVLVVFIESGYNETEILNEIMKISGVEYSDVRTWNDSWDVFKSQIKFYFQKVASFLMGVIL